MINLTSKELAALEDQISAELVLIKKYRSMSILCDDTKMKADLDRFADRHQQHYNTLMMFLQ